MPHLISNLVEKGFTPYTTRLAPKHLWSRPALGKYCLLIFKVVSHRSKPDLVLTQQWKQLGDLSGHGSATITNSITLMWYSAHSPFITSGGTPLSVTIAESTTTALLSTQSKEKRNGLWTNLRRKTNMERNERASHRIAEYQFGKSI